MARTMTVTESPISFPQDGILSALSPAVPTEETCTRKKRLVPVLPKPITPMTYSIQPEDLNFNHVVHTFDVLPDSAAMQNNDEKLLAQNLLNGGFQEPRKMSSEPTHLLESLLQESFAQWQPVYVSKDSLLEVPHSDYVTGQMTASLENQNENVNLSNRGHILNGSCDDAYEGFDWSELPLMEALSGTVNEICKTVSETDSNGPNDKEDSRDLEILEAPEYQLQRTHCFENTTFRDRFGCVSCDFIAYTQDDVKTHWIINHIHGKPYVCLYCTKRYTSTYMVMLHIQVFHEGLHMKYRIESGDHFASNIVIDCCYKVPVVNEMSQIQRAIYKQQLIYMFHLEQYGLDKFSLFASFKNLCSKLTQSLCKNQNSVPPEDDEGNHIQGNVEKPAWCRWMLDLKRSHEHFRKKNRSKSWNKDQTRKNPRNRSKKFKYKRINANFKWLPRDRGTVVNKHLGRTVANQNSSLKPVLLVRNKRHRMLKNRIDEEITLKSKHSRRVLVSSKSTSFLPRDRTSGVVVKSVDKDLKVANILTSSGPLMVDFKGYRKRKKRTRATYEHSDDCRTKENGTNSLECHMNELIQKSQLTRLAPDTLFDLQCIKGELKSKPPTTGSLFHKKYPQLKLKPVVILKDVMRTILKGSK